MAKLYNKYIILIKNDPFPNKKLKQRIMYEDEFLLHCIKQGMTSNHAKRCFDKNSVITRGKYDNNENHCN